MNKYDISDVIIIMCAIIVFVLSTIKNSTPSKWILWGWLLVVVISRMQIIKMREY